MNTFCARACCFWGPVGLSTAALAASSMLRTQSLSQMKWQKLCFSIRAPKARVALRAWLLPTDPCTTTFGAGSAPWRALNAVHDVRSCLSQRSDRQLQGVQHILCAMATVATVFLRSVQRSAAVATEQISNTTTWITHDLRYCRMA